METIRTYERAVAFLAALGETANVSRACEAVGISRTAAYEWRDADSGFATAWDQAMQRGVGLLEDEATRRAVEGVDTPLVVDGRTVYMMEPIVDAEGKQVENGWRFVLGADGKPMMARRRTYSDSLLALLLKANFPEKYRERSEVKVDAVDNLAEEMAAARARVRAAQAEAAVQAEAASRAPTGSDT